jgi:hypothetical protein
MNKIIYILFILNYSSYCSQLDTQYNNHAILMTHNSTSLKAENDSIINYLLNLVKKIPSLSKSNKDDLIGLLDSLCSLHSGNLVADQNLPLRQQLKDRVRGFKVPLHLFSNGEIYICHSLSRELVDSKISSTLNRLPAWITYLPAISHNIDNTISQLKENPCLLDKTYQQFRSFLNEINTFLEANPNEIITLYLDTFALENANAAIQRKIRVAFAESGIADKIYFDAGHNTGKPWPTLREMVNDKKKRLVIFAGHPHWENLGVFDHGKIVFRTNYDYKSVASLEEDSNKPQVPDGAIAENKLFMIDNYTTPLIAGSESDAAIVNNYDKLQRRFCQYQKLAGGLKPSILMVDFYQLPNNDPIRFINDWNAGKIDCSK